LPLNFEEMELLKVSDYDVEFVKYKNGHHLIDFDINPSFFQLFEYSSISSGVLKAEVDFLKSMHSLQFQISMSGFVDVSCDRCLEDIALPIHTDFILHVKITSNPGEEEEHLTYIDPMETRFNLSGYFLEMIQLSIPIRKTCEDASRKCSLDMDMFITGGGGVSTQTESNEQQDSTWEKLKNLLNNDEE
jgi:uncharacterized protein